MRVLESVTNIDIERAAIATIIMAIVGIWIFVKRRLIKHKEKTEEE